MKQSTLTCCARDLRTVRNKAGQHPPVNELKNHIIIQGAVYGGLVPEYGPRYPTIAARSLVDIIPSGTPVGPLTSAHSQPGETSTVYGGIVPEYGPRNPTIAARSLVETSPSGTPEGPLTSPKHPSQWGGGVVTSHSIRVT